jgi:VWFA-related protein
MRTWTVSLALLSLIISLIAPFPIHAQTPPSKEQDGDRIVVGTNEVVLDAVIKDKKGRAVKDLTAADFEILEDGVPQQVKSFRLVTHEAPPSVAPNGETTANAESGARQGVAPAAKPTNQPTSVAPHNTTRIGAIALVFDRLSPNARSVARQAALSYLSGGLRQDDFVGVFGIDLSLRVLQRFTNNEQLVRKAIDRGLSHSSSSYASATEQIGNLADQQAALQNQIDTSAAAGGPTNNPGGAIGAAAVDQQMAAMTQNVLEGFERLEHDQQGYATTDGLLAIVNSMARLPGRKALIFFSEGVATPTSVMPHFRSVISNANRANVSIYSVDAAGLRAESSDSQAGRDLTRLGQARARTAGSNADPFGSMMRDLERNEDLMNSNPDSALGALANETGGLLIANTNDPGPRLRQVGEDLHGYYVLTYTPKNQNYDGRFRQISLKVNRSGVDVQARKGYYAIDTSYGSPIMAYEAPALAVLSGKPRTNSFDSRAAAFSFPEAGAPGLVPVVAEAPFAAINFAVDKDKQTYHTDFSVVVIIKDDAQRVVRKLSKQYLLTGPLAKLAITRTGNFLFYGEANLDPGHYTMAAVIYDALTGQSSISTGTVVVPAADQAALRLSSIVFIKKAEQRSEATGQLAWRTFQFGEVLVYPNLSEPVSKAANKQLTFFVTIYTPKGDLSAPRLKLEIERNGRSVGQLSYNLDAPDQTGRIQYASAISLDKFQPGDYEVKLAVQAGSHTATRSEHVRVTP